MKKQLKIIAILPATNGTSAAGKSWTKSTVVGEEIEGQYPKMIAFDMFNKSDILDTLRVGAIVTVTLEISSRSYEGKWYTNVSAYKIETSAPQQVAAPAPVDMSGGDDLPF